MKPGRKSPRKTGAPEANSQLYQYIANTPPAHNPNESVHFCSPDYVHKDDDDPCQTISFLKVYFDFAYYLCVSPFRLEITSPGNKISIKSWWPQKVICKILLLLVFPWLIRDLRKLLPANPKNPLNYFSAVLHAINALSKCIAIRTLWWKQETVEGILQRIIEMGNEVELQSDGSKPKTKLISKTWNWEPKVIASVICAIYLTFALYDWISGRSVLANSEILRYGWCPNHWWVMMKEAGRYNLFLDVPLPSDGPDHLWLWQDIAYGMMASIGLLYRRIIGGYCDLLLLMCTLTLWTPARQLALKLDKNMLEFKRRPAFEKICREKCFESPGPGNWPQIYDQYNWVKELATRINSLIGNFTTCFMVACLLDYATTFEGVFSKQIRSGHWTKSLGMVFYLWEQSVILYFAADICHQVSTLKRWLSIDNNRRNVPADQLYFVVNEVDTNTVSIKGSNVFPITYQIVASMIGLSVTYFTICVQA